MNKTPSSSPKNNSNKPINFNTKNKYNTSPVQKNVFTLSSKPSINNKPSSKIAMTVDEKKNQPSQSPTNNPSTSFENPHQPIASPSQTIDNKQDTNTNAAHETHTVTNGPQPMIKSANINTNFASITAMESTPNRQQAIVFNSIDGIPQIKYVLAIGKIVKPINITFVSRISNNRFCIFLSSKQVLDNLMNHTQSISINDHTIQIRRLINPAKRIILSNVCPSIPNRLILEALKNIDINPTSQINHLKAGIKEEGYEHIMSFRRQMYINNEDFCKIPSSLIINVNDNQFRIFFTDDTLTCFLCKSNGHTSNNCKINPVSKPLYENTIKSSKINVHNETSEILPILSDTTQPPLSPKQNFNQEYTPAYWTLETDRPTSIISKQEEALTPTLPTNDIHKRPISDSSSLKPSDSPENIKSSITTQKLEKNNKES